MSTKKMFPVFYASEKTAVSVLAVFLAFVEEHIGAGVHLQKVCIPTVCRDRAAAEGKSFLSERLCEF